MLEVPDRVDCIGLKSIASGCKRSARAFGAKRLHRELTWLNFIDGLGWISLGIDLECMFLFCSFCGINPRDRSTAVLPKAQHGASSVSRHGVGERSLLMKVDGITKP